MDKLKMTSRDNVQANIEKIRQLFPNAVTEVLRDGVPTLAIDFDVLKQELSKDLVDDKEERYQFTWPDKKKAILLANTPVHSTLRPCVEESVNFDTTQNLYIEGDNLEVLKLLQETYLGKVKMIYIDPPYNTGNDFVYNDDFSMDASEYAEASGQYDEQGNRLFQNTESNGRFHTDWLNMIYPRLKVAKDLLSDDGVIFISIDDNEVTNLKKVCDEILGSDNFIAQFVWKGGRRNLAKYVSTSHEYMLCYAKNLAYCDSVKVEWLEKKKGLSEIYAKVNELVAKYSNDFASASKELKLWYKSLPDDAPAKDHEHYCWIDQKGVYFASDISRGGGGGPKWSIINPQTGNFVQIPSRGWAYAKKEDLLLDIERGNVHFNGDGVPCKKRYLIDNEKQVVETVFYKDRRGSSKRLRALMDGDIFPYPKDEEVLAKFIDVFSNKDGYVLDFFSGSATTAHAVMQLNAEDGGNRKFILVQLPEACDEKSEAFKAGYKNICEIGKERIRRAGFNIASLCAGQNLIERQNEIAKAFDSVKDGSWKEKMAIFEQMRKSQIGEVRDYKCPVDVGFRVLKLDSSNMQDVYYKPEEYQQSILDMMTDNIKPDRTPLDLLFQVMLELGKPLSAKIEEKTIAGKKVFVVDDNDLIACFDSDVSEETVKAIAQLKPLYAVFRDSSLASDSVAVNFDQIFATYSPNTTRKVL